ENHLIFAAAEGAERAAHERADRLRRLVLVANADAAADVDMAQRDAGRLQPVDERSEALRRRDERCRVVQERADVAADADDLELRLGFQVDAADAPGERELDLGFGFADAGEKCLGGGATGGEDSSELAARYDVESRAELGQKREDGEVRIRFDGIADPRVAAG